jgi:WD40 repeat protein
VQLLCHCDFFRKKQKKKKRKKPLEGFAFCLVMKVLKRVDPVAEGLYGSRFERDISALDVSGEDKVFFGLTGGGLYFQKHFLSGRAHLQVNCVKWFPSGQVAMSGGSDTLVKLWDLENELDLDDEAAAVLKGEHKTGVLSLGYVGRGAEVISGSRESCIMWKVGTQTKMQAFAVEAPVHTMQVTENRAILGQKDEALVYDHRAEKKVGEMKQKGGMFLSSTLLDEHTIRFGTDHGVVVEFDVRKPEEGTVVVKRSDEAQILSLCKNNYSTSIGYVNFEEGDDQLVGEVGQAVVALHQLSGGKKFLCTSTTSLVTLAK